MVMWVFGYGSLIWKAGFQYDQKVAGFIKGYRRVFYQGSTDHRGTPAFPGRTVTLEPTPGDLCWGVAYKVNGEDDENIALTYLEVREKQYDQKVYVDLFTDPSSPIPAVSGVMVYVASTDTKANKNYLGPAPIEEIAKGTIWSQPRLPIPIRSSSKSIRFAFLKIYLSLLLDFKHTHTLSLSLVAGCQDLHVRDVANAVRQILKEIKIES